MTHCFGLHDVGAPQPIQARELLSMSCVLSYRMYSDGRNHCKLTTSSFARSEFRQSHVQAADHYVQIRLHTLVQEPSLRSVLSVHVEFMLHIWHLCFARSLEALLEGHSPDARRGGRL